MKVAPARSARVRRLLRPVMKSWSSTRAAQSGAQLAADLVDVGVVPDVLDGAGEPAVTVEQRRGLGDGPPPVQVVLGVEGEVDADVFTPVPGGRLPRPRAGHHQGGAGGGAV